MEHRFCGRSVAKRAIGNMPRLGDDGFSTQGAVTMAPGAPWTICITPQDAAGKQAMFVADAG